MFSFQMRLEVIRSEIKLRFARAAPIPTFVGECGAWIRKMHVVDMTLPIRFTCKLLVTVLTNLGACMSCFVFPVCKILEPTPALVTSS
jgi:hypothetical protein